MTEKPFGIEVLTSEHVTHDEAFVFGWVTNEKGEKELTAAKITGIGA